VVKLFSIFLWVVYQPSPIRSFTGYGDSLGFPYEAQAYYSGFTGGVIPSEAHSGSLGDFVCWKGAKDRKDEYNI